MAPLQFKVKNFRFRGKMAAFDYDWTLVKPKNGGQFPKDTADWKWLRESVPMTLSKLYKQGYCIIVFTNQSKDWKVDQVRMAMESLDVPVLVNIGIEKSDQKPNIVMFDKVVSGKKWNEKKSFYVGDALGRVNDWSDMDKVFAEKAGLPFMPPEQLFPVDENGQQVQVVPSENQEVVVMTGYPGSGKTTIANNVFGTNPKYVVLHGDQLKTSKAMLKKAIPYLKDGLSVVFDSTNPSVEKRAEYIKLADDHKIPTRCVHVTTSIEESMMRNNSRPKDKIVPKIVYYRYRKLFKTPSIEEGCTVVTI